MAELLTFLAANLTTRILTGIETDIELGISRIRYQYPVKFRYPVSDKILPDNISVFEIGETAVKTLERELKSYLTGLTSRAFICRLPNLSQFYLNQWKHIHILFKFQL